MSETAEERAKRLAKVAAGVGGRRVLSGNPEDLPEKFDEYRRGSRSPTPWTREREIGGDTYRLDLWSTSMSLRVRTQLARRFGDALAAGILGFVRYMTRRSGAGGQMVTVLEDQNRAEDLLVGASEVLLRATGEDELNIVARQYLKGVKRKQRGTWVDVIDLRPRELEVDHGRVWFDEDEDSPTYGLVLDERQWPRVKDRAGSFVGENEPIGFDLYYRGRDHLVLHLIFWVLTENLGGFISDALSSLLRGRPDGTSSGPENSSTEDEKTPQGA